MLDDFLLIAGRARRWAKVEGSELLSDSDHLEILASLFGYEHCQSFSHITGVLRSALAHPEAAVILAKEEAVSLAVELSARSGFSPKTASRCVSLLSLEVEALLPGRVYSNQDSFLAEHLNPYVPDYLLQELEHNLQMSIAHQLLPTACKRVEENPPRFSLDVWLSRVRWTVRASASIHPTEGAGSCDRGSGYLQVGVDVDYQKLERAIVSTRPWFSPAWASVQK